MPWRKVGVGKLFCDAGDVQKEQARMMIETGSIEKLR